MDKQKLDAQIAYLAALIAAAKERDQLAQQKLDKLRILKSIKPHTPERDQ